MSSNANKLPADAPEPRLCHLIKWPDFDGYGFNLHAEKSRTGQFIGKVDEGSPAQYAGMKEGDRIVEVNGDNISQENHKQVVERIKSKPYETCLLVVDPAADRWYKERKIVVKGALPNVRCLKTPVPRPPAGEPPCYENIAPQNHAVNGVHETNKSPTNNKHEVQPEQHQNGHAAKNGSTKPDGKVIQAEEKAFQNVSEEKQVSQNGSVPSEVKTPPKVSVVPEGKVNGSPLKSNYKEETNGSRSSTPMESNTSVPDSPHSTRSSRSTNSAGASSNGPASLEDGILNLNMSASEMRQMLANRRKKDPKKEQMDIRQKYEIIQQM